MASLSCRTTVSILALLFFSIFSCFHVSCFEFQVGGSKGWVVPPANDTKIYNDWASKNRFRAGDALRFRYKKDSVMEVSEADYKNCNSSRPSYFSNAGNTVFKLDRSGYFYFISGASGHCDKGQRMIVKVMSDEDQDDSQNTKSSGFREVVSTTAIFQFVLVFLASYVV